jgi:hypothetical protein
MITITDTITIAFITIAFITIAFITIAFITIAFITIAFITIAFITIAISPGPNAPTYAHNRWEAGIRFRWKI